MILNKKLAWFLMGACFVVALFSVAYPMYVIRPFRAQGDGELAAALAIKRWGPLLAAGAAVLAIFLTASLWRHAAKWAAKAVSVFAGVLTIAAAALSYVNVYEIMFHRIDSPQTMPVSEAKLDDDDMVLGIRITGQSRAYPIRMMGYHHIVNDRLAGVAIAATY